MGFTLHKMLMSIEGMGKRDTNLSNKTKLHSIYNDPQTRFLITSINEYGSFIHSVIKEGDVNTFDAVIELEDIPVSNRFENQSVLTYLDNNSFRTFSETIQAMFSVISHPLFKPMEEEHVWSISWKYYYDYKRPHLLIALLRREDFFLNREMIEKVGTVEHEEISRLLKIIIMDDRIIKEI